MSDETMAESHSAPMAETHSAPSAHSDGATGPAPDLPNGEASGETRGDSPSPEEGGAHTDGAPRRRRRGSRGGRNHKRPGVPQDRALTNEDVAAGAREDAGLPEAGVEPVRADGVRADKKPVAREADTGAATGDTPDAKPRIGDTRPAPPPPAGDGRPAPARPSSSDGSDMSSGPEGPGTRRRRRRGGRGRGGSGAGSATSGAAPANTPGDRTPGGRGPRRNGGNGGSTSRGGGNSGRSRSAKGAGAHEVVTADLGIGERGPDEVEAAVRRRGGQSTHTGRATGRYQMIVHVAPDGVKHLAVLEGRSLTEHYVSRPEDATTSIDGNIYLGRVQNVLPGMEAAFVDFGTPKNGVLYRNDVAYDPADVDDPRPRIEQMLKNGQTIIVQVTKNPIGHKGARLTQEVSLAGRFVVMVPGRPDTYGISKRLGDDERRRLRRILEAVRPPDAGLIVRTAAEGATADELERDVARLASQWEQILALAQRSKTSRLLYQEPPLVVRLVREEFTKDYRSVVIDDPELYEDVRGYVAAIAPELVDRIEHYEDPSLPVFERFHVHEQLHKALDRKVWLPSGGSLIIERTEALTVIDVNTGKNVGSTNLEETVYRNNLEAAEEVAHQLRLRDIGGIIVIDFIDMEDRPNREDVIRTFRDALARDKTRTQVFDISELGLVEMTRKRISEGLVETFSHVCPECGGRGLLVDHDML